MQRKRRGQALVEFALVIGVAVLLSIGAIQTLRTFYLTRQVRAAAEEIADLAAVLGGDTEELRQRVNDPESGILPLHRLDPLLAELEIDPPVAPYLEPIRVTLHYHASVRLYGLFDWPIPSQAVQRLSEGG